VRAPEQCQVLLPDRCPAYITVERFTANQERLAANRARATARGALGAPRSGPSLLGGLVMCGRCGQRMMIGYTNGSKGLRYSCNRAVINYAEPMCQSLAGQGLDDLVSAQILAALQPQALQLSLVAVADLEQERARLHRHHQQELERANYQVDRARRQYQAVEPENRLVARELERAWNEAMQHQQQVQASYDQFRRTQPTGLSDAEREQIAALAENIPALWHAATTTAGERQEIARLLLQSASVEVQGQSEQVQVRLTWKGGHVSAHAFTRSVDRYAHRSDYAKLLARIEELSDSGLSLASVAEQLNREGSPTAQANATVHTRDGGTSAVATRGSRFPTSVSDGGGNAGGERVVPEGSGAGTGDAVGHATALAEGGLGGCAEAAGGEWRVGAVGRRGGKDAIAAAATDATGLVGGSGGVDAIDKAQGSTR